jgi:hypothetical protein
MHSRDLSYNSLTRVPAEMFAGTLQLQTMYVFCVATIMLMVVDFEFTFKQVSNSTFEFRYRLACLKCVTASLSCFRNCENVVLKRLIWLQIT